MIHFSRITSWWIVDTDFREKAVRKILAILRILFSWIISLTTLHAPSTCLRNLQATYAISPARELRVIEYRKYSWLTPYTVSIRMGSNAFQGISFKYKPQISLSATDIVQAHLVSTKLDFNETVVGCTRIRAHMRVCICETTRDMRRLIQFSGNRSGNRSGNIRGTATFHR